MLHLWNLQVLKTFVFSWSREAWESKEPTQISSTPEAVPREAFPTPGPAACHPAWHWTLQVHQHQSGGAGCSLSGPIRMHLPQGCCYAWPWNEGQIKEHKEGGPGFYSIPHLKKEFVKTRVPTIWAENTSIYTLLPLEFVSCWLQTEICSPNELNGGGKWCYLGLILSQLCHSGFSVEWPGLRTQRDPSYNYMGTHLLDRQENWDWGWKRFRNLLGNSSQYWFTPDF